MDEKDQDSIGYAFKGKIMISSITILFTACFIIVTFHVYARWCRRRRASAPPAAAAVISHGLDLLTVKSLPTFVYASENQESARECAVCLSEFEERERGRILPECRHCFHVDCIDAWLQSHRHCPLCRTRVTGQVPPGCTLVSICALGSPTDGGISDGIIRPSSHDPD